MSSAGGQSPSIQFLFHSELQQQVAALVSLIAQLKKSEEPGALYADLVRVTHSIKGAAKLIMQEPIVALAGVWELYFKGEQKTQEPLSEEAAQQLAETLALLQALAQGDPAKLLQNIQEQEPKIRSLVARAKSLIHESEKLQNNGASSETYMFHKGEEPRIRELLEQMASVCEKLNSSLGRLPGESSNEELLCQLQEAAALVKNCGEKLPLAIVYQMGEALVHYFQAALEKQLIWTKGHLALVVEAADLLLRLARQEPSALSGWLAEHEASMESIAGVIQVISQQSMVASPPIVRTAPLEQGDISIIELFNVEAETQAQILLDGLILMEAQPGDKKQLEQLMRAAHSLKGAARVVDFLLLSRLAHAMEDYFTSINENKLEIKEQDIDILLQAVDLIKRCSQQPPGEGSGWLVKQQKTIEAFISAISGMGIEGSQRPSPKLPPLTVKEQTPEPERVLLRGDHFIRVSAKKMNKLMGLAGESLVESRWLAPFAESLLNLKRRHNDISFSLSRLQENLEGGLKTGPVKEAVDKYLIDLKQALHGCHKEMSERLSELDMFIRRYSHLSDRLYSEVIASRMRPFSDGVEGMARMVRDMARQLGKKAILEVRGKTTEVDREILERLEAPLTHLLRNAVDHGIETVEERQQAGKPPVGTIYLEASHKAGMLVVTVADDGRGIDLTALRQEIIKKQLATASIAEKLTAGELLEFIFLPGFTTAPHISDISGRGVGLSVVQNAVQEVGGSVKVALDKGVVFQLLLPTTLSVLRSLLVEIGGETYAFPLARIEKVLTLSREEIKTIEQRQYYCDGDKNIGLVPAHQVLELVESSAAGELLSVVLISDTVNDYALVVDAFLGEKELVLQELELINGKIPDVSSGAFLENGDPLLVLDIDDMIRSIDKLLTQGPLKAIAEPYRGKQRHEKKRILVVDDSITVREVECRLLENRGYSVESAINGVDGWNALRLGSYDLVITDIDMPRMNGIEFVKAIRGQPGYEKLPVMIVSYKEREEDKALGLEAGADYYLTKSSFHDETLLSAVIDLIGEP